MPAQTKEKCDRMNFSPDSKLMVFFTKLVDLTRINLLWLICCLPVFTVGASTTAMLTALYAFRAGEQCGWKVFFTAFRRSFGKATALWLILAFFAVMLGVDYCLVAYMEFPGRMAVIGLIFFFAILLLFVFEMIFPLLSQFPGTLRDMAVNAVLLSLSNLPKLLLVSAMNLLPLLLFLLLPQIFLLLGFFWLICGFALVALYDISVLERVLGPFREQVVSS